MRFVDEFRDAELGRVLAGEILATVEPGRHYKVMEVCGGHTHAIYKYGIDDLLPENVELVHGPGCPVCVIPMGRVDDGIALAREPGVIFTCFGDMMRVPGSAGSLLDAKIMLLDEEGVEFASATEAETPSCSAGADFLASMEYAASRCSSFALSAAKPAKPRSMRS